IAEGALPRVDVRHSSGIAQVVPTARVRYLSEITEAVRSYHAETERLAAAARKVQQVEVVHGELADNTAVAELLEKSRKEVPHEIVDQIANWPAVVESYSGDEQVVKIRDKE